jgi:hypothetical protein
MDLVDLISEKRFLGQEFLTWLWWKSEERGGAVALPERGDITVVFAKHMLLESGEGETVEKILCSGLQAELQEARTGLRMGKKLEQARIVIGYQNYEFALTLAGSIMEFRNVRLPKTEESEERESAGRDVAFEGMVLERIFLYELLLALVHDLYRLFVLCRVSSMWPEEKKKIRHWVAKMDHRASVDPS